MKGLRELREEAYRIAVERGFKDATIIEDFALMHAEISKALETHRDGRGVREVWYEEKIPVAAFDEHGKRVMSEDGEPIFAVLRHRIPGHRRKPAGIPHELAGVMIRVLYFCGKYDIDIEKAVAEKMVYNELL
jgi:hypothetical protein